MPAIIDLSHSIENGMITYKGLPAPVICDFLSREESRKRYAPGVEFQIGRIDMVANTGTYIDSPFHRHAHMDDLAKLPLSSIAGVPSVVVRATDGRRGIGAAFFDGLDLRGKGVIVDTGWSAHWRTDGYFEHHPFLTQDAAEFLVSAGAVIVGIDSLNIDDTDDLSRPVHSILLGNNIPIVEHMTNLGRLPDDGFRFFAVPPKVQSFGSFPVRAFALSDLLLIPLGHHYVVFPERVNAFIVTAR